MRIDEFKEKFQALKEDENWKDILGLITALRRNGQPLQPNEKAYVSGIATRCHFYSGNFDAAKNENQAVTDILLQEKGRIDVNLVAEHYYLYSAVHRAKADKLKEKGQDYSVHQKEAEESIGKALAYADGGELSDFLKAKVYFNAGALMHDIAGDTQSAHDYYGKAIDEFKKLGKSDDINRMQLRDIRAYLEEGRLLVASTQAMSMESQIPPDSKTKVHLLQLQGKIYCAQGKYNPAEKCFNSAIELAERKGMQRDVERLSKLLEPVHEQLHTSSTVLERINPEAGSLGLRK